MKMKKSQLKHISYLLFLLIVAGDLWSLFTPWQSYEYWFKPLIMIWVLVYFAWQSKGIRHVIKQPLFFAFVFSWGGDVALLFQQKNELFFLLGLGSFLIAQISYVVAFTFSVRGHAKAGFIKRQPWWVLLIIMYGGLLYALLFENLDSTLKIAVFIYAASLVVMGLAALNRRGCVPASSFWFVMCGGVLFILSDSVIAINKFLLPFEGANILIMSTYILAQYLIMQGGLRQVLQANR
ncbi:lysoplasmalogenase [Rapidithrix thailandica]|uniref:Lysoplasmalogenase n=1 Tax=Rapidithrix thailandica TaxID=413964 RepID=A0AAW9RWR5_9BACT